MVRPEVLRCGTSHQVGHRRRVGPLHEAGVVPGHVAGVKAPVSEGGRRFVAVGGGGAVEGGGEAGLPGGQTGSVREQHSKVRQGQNHQPIRVEVGGESRGEQGSPGPESRQLQSARWSPAAAAAHFEGGGFSAVVTQGPGATRQLPHAVAGGRIKPPVPSYPAQGAWEAAPCPGPPGPGQGRGVALGG